MDSIDLIGKNKTPGGLIIHKSAMGEQNSGK